MDSFSKTCPSPHTCPIGPFPLNNWTTTQSGRCVVFMCNLIFFYIVIFFYWKKRKWIGRKQVGSCQITWRSIRSRCSKHKQLFCGLEWCCQVETIFSGYVSRTNGILDVSGSVLTLRNIVKKCYHDRLFIKYPNRAPSFCLLCDEKPRENIQSFGFFNRSSIFLSCPPSTANPPWKFSPQSPQLYM